MYVGAVGINRGIVPDEDEAVEFPVLRYDVPETDNPNENEPGDDAVPVGKWVPANKVKWEGNLPELQGQEMAIGFEMKGMVFQAGGVMIVSLDKRH